VRSGDGRSYSLGLLLDTEEHYANRNVAERYVTRPGILRAFGWNVLTVLTRDWYHDPGAVLERALRRLRGEPEDEPPVEPLPEPAAPAAEPAAEEVAEPAPAAGSPQLDAVSASPPANVRRCEFVEGRSSKFWEIGREGGLLTIRYGRIGTHGQTLTKSFDTPERAERELAKLLDEKLRKGYREVPVA
jgi:predicted DNA-binding WGR domain protein